MWQIALVVLVLAIDAPPRLAAQAPAGDLTGHWEGTGTILGQPARVSLDWEPVLGGRFARLLWISHIGPEGKAQRFEGHAYYQRTDTGHRATWFDSSGAIRPIVAVMQDGALVASWGTRETELGDTSYRRVGPDRLEIVDRVLGKTGQWREFGRSTLERRR